MNYLNAKGGSKFLNSGPGIVTSENARRLILNLS